MTNQEPLIIFLMRFVNRWDDIELPEGDRSSRILKYCTEQEKAEYLIEEIMKRYIK
jgi:hypothetical protein